MDLYKSFQVSTDYKDRNRLPNWETRQVVEVAFVDNTHPGSQPLVYQLKDSFSSIEALLNTSKFHATAFSRDAFLLLGISLNIDKKKKQVLLTNKNIVNYSHLVIVSGRKPLLSFEDDELISALQALGDALRVKPKIPSSFASLVRSSGKKTSPKNVHDKGPASDDTSMHNVEKLVQTFITASTLSENPHELNTLNRRLYEVQI